ncbi:MAG TPA: MgtC/SapB family protein [Thermoanaerobaculia bacterium]|jgi:putative Mg2+ transporter-C (MgtC) family protein|nr:MgtC/SapB family protein [Thermoanaerobaculia bacterium]
MPTLTDPAAAIGYLEILSRLTVAVIIGCILGLNRELHGKPAGVRTHGLVALGAALLTVTGVELSWLSSTKTMDYAVASRFIQGIITGIGFLGAGVILRDDLKHSVHGLTTAASIWLSACLGIACGLGCWTTAVMALGLTLVILIFGGPFERAIHHRLHPKDVLPDIGPPSDNC